MAIRAGNVATASLCPVKRRVGHLHQPNRIPRILGKARDADTDREMKPCRRWIHSPGYSREHVFLYTAAHSLCCHQSLQVIRIEQERRKLLASKTSGHVTSSKCSADNHSDVLERAIADEVAVAVVDCFEVIEVHHQNAKRFRSLFSARRFASELGEERLAGEQAGKFVVTEESLNLLLKRAIDLVDEFETK